MHVIEDDLRNHKCKTCDNLYFWDWYFCGLEKHQDGEGFLSEQPLKECEGYVKRKGIYNGCKNHECIFWCLECPAYKNREDKEVSI